MGGGRKNKAHYGAGKGQRASDEMARNLDKLAEYEMFDSSILPQLQKMVMENWSPDKIRKAFAPLMQARMVQMALGDAKSPNTMKAVKDILDRHEGTAVQRVDNVTTYAKMDKRELAALALQKLRDSGLISVDGKVVKRIDSEDDEDTE